MPLDFACSCALLVSQSAVRFKVICMQVMSQLLGGEIDYEKVLKITVDTGHGSSDVKAAVAALDFIISRRLPPYLLRCPRLSIGASSSVLRGTTLRTPLLQMSFSS